MLQDRLSFLITGSLARTCCLEVHFNNNIAVQKNLAEDEALSVSHKTKEASNVGTRGVKGRVENPTNSEDVHNSLGKHYV